MYCYCSTRRNYFFPNFWKTLVFIVKSVISSFPRKYTHLLHGKGNDDSTENMSGITGGHQNYKKCECKDKIMIGA